MRRAGRLAVLLPGLPFGLLLAVLLLGPGTALALAPVSVAGDAPENGIFDPSIEYAPGASEGWLLYSAVYGDAEPWGPHVETHLARTQDGGESFDFVSVLNPSTPGQIDIPGEGTVDGVWNYEVSSLVHDPGDPGAEWKVFSHRIFRRTTSPFTTEQNEPAFSWISLRTAADPNGPWSAETALLSAGPLPPPPWGAAVAVAVNELDESLEGLLVYSEPGAFAKDGVLYLSLTGLVLTGSDRIVLLASDDHGASWRYVGTPLSNADAPSLDLGYLSFDGSALVEDLGRVFLLVTPSKADVVHHGTLAFEFASLADAELVRQGGAPVLHHAWPPQPGLPPERRGGQADYHEGNVVGGLLQPALHAEDLPELFQFASTGSRVVVVALPSGGALPGAAAALVAAGLWLARRSRAQAAGSTWGLGSGTRSGR